MGNRNRLERVERLLERLDAAVVVRDPGNARSAEQFEGLRKQIALAAKNHRVHVAHLLSLSDSARKGASLELLSERIEDFLAELGVTRISEYLHPDLFDVVETVEGATDGIEVLEPAVVETMESGELNRLQLGKVRKVVGPPIEVVPTGEPVEMSRKSISREDGVGKSPKTARQVVLAVALLLIGLLMGRLVFGGSDAAEDSPATTTTVAMGG
jgi:hypothetical protein